MEKEYVPEGYLYQDAFLGGKDSYQRKIDFLANLAQPEEWNYPGSSESQDNFAIKTY